MINFQSHLRHVIVLRPATERLEDLLLAAIGRVESARRRVSRVQMDKQKHTGIIIAAYKESKSPFLIVLERFTEGRGFRQRSKMTKLTTNVLLLFLLPTHFLSNDCIGTVRGKVFKEKFL